MTRKMRLLIAGVVLVAVVALAWFFLISPLRSDIATTNEAITVQIDKLATARAALAQAQTTRAEGKKNQARLLELAKMVPETSQVPSLLVQIQDLADQSGIDFISDPNEAGAFQIIPLQLQFTGTFFDLSDFAYRVEQLVAGPGRLMTVKTVSLKVGSSDTAATADGESTAIAVDDSPLLDVSMTLYAFCMNPASTTASTTKSSGGSTAASTTNSTTNPATPN
jgi:Tfp pilus assembly protein PilO